ncbi:hypothetical protein ALC60_13084 [Trachymyrmex zeteki]|uniref:THAP9-like helix-turn-helix domain-containing protein n=1 Tax=Mycetomoellerius zeteki TaxID=64791 RepID=A0A151WJK2_9HYME|nr:hypothetical protein ALC60_13084 [Trachymyrmex zeteki]
MSITPKKQKKSGKGLLRTMNDNAIDYKKVSSERRRLVEELHAPARRNFPRRRVIVRGYDNLWPVTYLVENYREKSVAGVFYEHELHHATHPDDFAEESDAELRKFRICSKHFSTNMIYPSGRLKKNAEPVLRFRLEARDKIINRLRKKILIGDLPDKSILNALFRRVQGFLLTFLIMQLFHKERNVYTDEEKQLAKKMHYTSPSLYRKMREEFGFILPSEGTIKTWFNM